ncbi:MAG TPA: ATP-dependent zinc metalloprotease FtsH [Candidatus Limnocylindria bacterium]|nr:ATP-dependent zinc metalloprotease FtsH [Candidatus Limnocylindria bacterium]
MAEDNDSNRSSGSGPNFQARTWIVWIVIAAMIPLLLFFQKSSQQRYRTISHRTLLDLVSSNLVESAEINYSSQSQNLRTVRGKYFSFEGGKTNLVPFSIETRLTQATEDRLLDTGTFSAVDNNNLFLQVMIGLLPFFVVGAIIWFVFVRQIKAAGKGALSFGKSKARLLAKDKNKTTFKDVAGVEEAKEEVAELVEFLKDPKKFQKLGGRIPKGVLMVGPPGTGKTLIAKAIAGEADASFFSISGSDFVEMFVGVGASRVRDMFEQARKATPCLIFIDEIDAVGRSRGHGLGGGNDEREQTLNALLVEMDGFDTQEGIIIIAATNRPDVLDPALLRPGRFDRQVTVNLPDVRGREAILKVHAKNVKLDSSVDLSIIARGTPGFSGAELANLLNEAALIAARGNRKSVGQAELEEARDKVRWGRERRSLAMTDEEKKFTAWHEAGHALVNVVLTHTHPLHKVTIIPRGQALGATMYLPKDDVLSRRYKEMVDTIAVTMAGRIAEQIVSDDISTGASGDIQQATSMAKAMVMHYGMSEKLGMVLYGEANEYVFLGRDMMRSKEYSEITAQQIDAETKRIIDDGYNTAKSVIEAHRDKLELIANALLEYETLEGSQVADIVRTGTFTPPPVKPSDIDPPSGAQAATPLPEVLKPVPPKLPGFGSATPAAA